MIKVSECKKELLKSKKIRGRMKKRCTNNVCWEWKFQNKSACVEVRHESLVDKLEEKLCRLMFGQQEEKCLQADGMTKEINEDYKLHSKWNILTNTI